jgi:hypothetical protein
VHFGIRFFLLLGILASLLFILGIPDINRIWLAVFGIIFFMAISLVTLSPMMTQHEITGEGIVLRQGLLFWAEFSFGEIEAVELSQARLWALGFFPAGARGRIVLANGNRNLVSIKLKARRRFGMLLLQSASEIIIDLEKPDDFVKHSNEKLKG